MDKKEFVKQINELIEFDKKCQKINSLINDLTSEEIDNVNVSFHYDLTVSHVKNIIDRGIFMG